MKVTKRLQNKLNNYPKNFYDFSDGVNVSVEEIKEDLIKLAEQLSPTNTFAFTASGNTMISAFCLGPEKNGKYEIMFTVSRNYKELTLHDVDLDDIDSLNKPKKFFDI